MKRTPLRRGTKPIARTSKKRTRQNRIRTKVLREMGKGTRMCERCGERKATDGHEVLRRSAGGSITDRTNIRLLCRPCHRWVTENPQRAMATGWTISRFAGHVDRDSEVAGETE